VTPHVKLVDYFEDQSDLEASLDLPVLGHLTWESRFHQLQDGLQGLAPDPRVSERLYQFVRSDAPVIWVVGLGDGGEEVPVAVGLAERVAAAGRLPVLLLGPERDRPRGLGAAGLRPISAGPYAPVLGALYPGGCGAQASGIQGVLRVWPGSDSGVQPIEPAGVIVAGRVAGEGLVPHPDLVTGTVLVAPYRDCPAQVISEEVTRLRSMGYPLLGLVAVSARAVERRGQAARGKMADPADKQTEVEQEPGQGGIMKGAADDREREGGFFADDGETDDTSRDLERADEAPEVEEPEAVEPQPPMSGDGPFAAEARPQSSWDEDFVPGRRAHESAGRARLPWWTWVLVLIALGAVAIMASRLIGIEGGRPQAGPARPVPSRAGSGAITQTTEPVVSPAAVSGSEVATPMAARQEDIASGQQPVTPPQPVTASEPLATQPQPVTASEPLAAQPQPAATAETPAAQPPAAAAPTMARRQPPFSLMCGSFRTADRARLEASRLAGVGLEARVVAVEIPGQGLWHRVVVGSWPDAAQAREAGRRALSAGWVKDAMLVAGNGYGSPIPGKLN